MDRSDREDDVTRGAAGSGAPLTATAAKRPAVEVPDDDIDDDPDRGPSTHPKHPEDFSPDDFE